MDYERPRGAFLLLLGIVFFAFAAYEWCRAPLTSWYGSSFGISESFLGFIVGASTLTGVFLKFPSGVFSDVFGRKRVLLLGTCFFAFTPLIYRFATSPWILLGVRFVHGCATAIYGPAALAIVADLFREKRATAIGMYTAVASSGKALGPLAMGYVFVATDRNFPLTYLLAAPVGFGAFLLALVIRPPRPEGKSVESVWVRMARSFREAVSDGRVIFTAVVDGVVMLAAGAIQAFLPIYALKVRGFTEIETSWLFGAQILTSLLSRPLMGLVSDGVGRKPMILVGMVVAAVSFGAIGRTASYSLLLVLACAFGLAEAIIHTSGSAFAADLCKRRSLGSAMGVFGAVTDVGHASGPILTGAILMALGQNYAQAFLIVAVVILLFAGLFAFFVRE